MNKMLFAASFLPLAASAAPADPSAAVQQAFPAYSIDFRQAVLLAQVELKRAPADIATTADGIKTTLGGDKDRGNDKAGKGGDGYTQGGYKEQGKTAGAGKDKGPDAYTTGGYKEQAKTAGAGKDKSGDGYTAGGYKDQAKTAGAGKDKSGDGYASGGYKEQSKTAGAGKDRSDDGYTSGGYKEQGKTAGAGKEAGAMPDEGSKALGGMKDHKDAGAGKMLADGYKTAAIAKATGDATRFSLLLDEYRNAPEVTRKRLWLDTVQQVLADNRKVVGGDSRQLIYVPMGGAQAQAAPAPAGALPAEVVMPQVESTSSGARSSVRTPRREEAQP